MLQYNNINVQTLWFFCSDIINTYTLKQSGCLSKHSWAVCVVSFDVWLIVVTLHRNVGQQSDVQRLRQHLSGTSPESAGVSHHHGNLSVMIGSPSPSQETAMREEQSENQLPCSEIFYQLSLDNEINTSIREEFYYDHVSAYFSCDHT